MRKNKHKDYRNLNELRNDDDKKNDESESSTYGRNDFGNAAIYNYRGICYIAVVNRNSAHKSSTPEWTVTDFSKLRQGGDFC